MSALGYLFLTNIKNTIKDLKNHPTKLIMILLLIGVLGFVLWSGNSSSSPTDTIRDIQELYVGIFALFSVLFITTVMTGFSSGASFYSMADINLLFMAPISSKKILIYGLIKQMSNSLLVGFFLFFQYAWLNRTYQIGIYGLFVLFIGFGIMIFCAQLTSMAIYSFTSNNEKLKKILKTSIIALSVIVLVIISKDALLASGADKLNAIISSVNSLWVLFIPVIGWIKAVTVGLMSFNFTQTALGLAAVISYIIAFIILIIKANADFYEDVLQATEVSFSAITAKKEGKISDTPKNVKLGKTGINKGFGPNVFFYKHMLENRRSGLLFIDKTTLVFIAMSIFFTIIFMRDMGNILAIFGFVTYMQIFNSASGRWIRELIQPYIYMIPEPAFKKLICITQENMLKIVVEAIILFAAIGMIIKAPIYQILICIIARIGFGILFMAGNILIQRVLGSLTNKILISFLYFFILIILSVPGFILGFLLSLKLVMMPIESVILISTFIWNLLSSALIIYLCRDILNYAELNNR